VQSVEKSTVSLNSETLRRRGGDLLRGGRRLLRDRGHFGRRLGELLDAAGHRRHRVADLAERVACGLDLGRRLFRPAQAFSTTSTVRCVSAWISVARSEMVAAASESGMVTPVGCVTRPPGNRALRLVQYGSPDHHGDHRWLTLYRNREFRSDTLHSCQRPRSGDGRGARRLGRPFSALPPS